MNWGYKILIVYMIFIGGIGFLVFKSTMQNQDLVTPDYYEQELKYQQKIDEIQRSNQLSASVKYELKNGVIDIIFPKEMKDKEVTAQVLLYCIADKIKDTKKEFTTNTAAIAFNLPAANKGLHELQINWQSQGVTYYYKDKILVP